MKTSPHRTIFRPATRDPLIRNAVVNFDPSGSPGLVATGYRLAARRLVLSALADRGDQDFLVGPIAFLYRQSVELALKHVIALGGTLADTGRTPPHGHELRALWMAARAVIRQVDPGAEPACAQVDPIIDELAATDPQSDAFRYPVRRDGRPAWPADLSLIDLQQLGEVMDDLCEKLEAAGDMVGAAVDAHQEWLTWQREMAEEYREG